MKTLVYRNKQWIPLIIAVVLFAAVIHTFSASVDCYSPFSPGVILHAVPANPSLLSAASYPNTVIQSLLPVSANFHLSNDKFIIPAPLSLMYAKENPGCWLAFLLRESFDLSGMNPQQVSHTLTEKLQDGVAVETRITIPYFQFTRNGLHLSDQSGAGIGICSYFKGMVHLPGGIFTSIFSPEKGLQPGNTIGFTDLAADIEIGTDFHLSYGRRLKKEFFLKRIHHIQTAWGIDLMYRMGHSILLLETNQGEISFSKENILSIKGESVITTAGIGLEDNYQFQSPFKNGFPINGHGFGITAGLTFYTEQLSLSFGIDNLGIMIWDTGLRQTKILINADSLYLLDLLQDPSNAATLNSSFTKRSSLTLPLETSFKLQFSYKWHIPVRYHTALRDFIQYHIFSLGYNQPLVKDMRRPVFPVITAMIENGFVNGTFPCRIGWTLGSRKQCTSFIEVEQVTKGLTFSIWYRAVADLLFRSKKGAEIGIRSHVFWDK